MATLPPTRRTDDGDTLWGQRIDDPYRWLEDAGDPEVQAWMDAQDAHTRAFLAGIPEREALRDRCRELFYYDGIGCPLRRGDRLFYTRRHRDKEKEVVYVRRDGGDEEVLFDPNEMSADGTISLGVWTPSDDGSLVAYALRENNADAATLYVRDMATGRDLETDVIDGAKYAFPAWLPDGSGFYYTRLPTDPDIPIDELPGHAAICFHAIGDDPAGDRQVRAPTGSPQTFVNPWVSRDGRWLIVYVQHGWNSTDVYLADRDRSDTDFVPICEGIEALFDVVIWNDRLYAVTNDGAPRYRIMTASIERPEHAAWTELVGEDEATLEGIHVIGGQLVCRYLRDAAAELRVLDTDGREVRQLALPGLGSVTALTGREDDPELFYAYSSFTEPTRIVRMELPGGAPEEWARIEVAADTDAVVCDQVRYRSKDGTEIPMFILRRRDVDARGDRPTILTGYGGFNLSMTPSFMPAVLPWIERGGVWAIPNLRGGGEYGESWHRAGMRENKQNVFDDFIAAAEHLIEAGWTRPDKLAIRGGSNGGLLVGAAMTQRPELFGAVICAVPLLDMLRYHLFGSGRTWIPEYGTAEEEEQFRWLAAYSPLQKVEAGVDYPALLMLSADSDDRVDPMHARKFVAAVQHATSGDRPVLLRIERNAGHGGADMIAQQVDQVADTMAFLADRLGLTS